MEPTIQDGSPVVIATNAKTIVSGKIYAFLVDGEPLLKRLFKLPNNRVRVVSDNQRPEFADYEVAANDLEIIGRAVWTPTRL
jgi:phage repressor protein C with HTH and peptisase S24 domain